MWDAVIHGLAQEVSNLFQSCESVLCLDRHCPALDQAGQKPAFTTAQDSGPPGSTGMRSGVPGETQLPVKVGLAPREPLCMWGESKPVLEGGHWCSFPELCLMG